MKDLRTDVEKLKVMVMALNEARKSFIDRFSELNERIGEIRSMLLEREKEIKELKTSYAKLLKLSEELDLEEVSRQLKLHEEKMKVLKELIEKNERMISKMIDQMKEFRTLMLKFKGIETLEKIYKEIKDHVMLLKKLEASTKSNSEKSVSIFREITKKWEEISKIKKSFEELKEEFSVVKRDIEKLNVLASDFVRKSEIDDIKAELEKKARESDELLDELKENLRTINKAISTSGLEKIKKEVEKEKQEREEIKAKVENLLVLSEKVDTLSNEISMLRAELDSIREEIGKFSEKAGIEKLKADIEKENVELRKRVIKMEKSQKDLEKRIKDIEKRFKEVSKKIESLKLIKYEVEIGRLNKKVDEIIKILEKVV